MTIGSKIAQSRKNMGMTQDALAQKLGVTNQAVSKWESDQSCPDIQLLPQLADIFGVTMDELFDRQPNAEKVKADYEAMFGIPSEKPEEETAREEPETQPRTDLPWEDDGVLRVVLYVGHTYVGSCPEQEKITFEYEGPALNIECAVNVSCGDVEGSVRAEGNVNCDAVYGDIHAKGNVACDDVEGHVDAGGSVTCDSVDGNVSAGGNVTCDEVEGSVNAGGNVICDEIGGSATAGGTVSCGGSGGFHISFGDDREDGGDKKEKKKKGFTFRF